ncbi:hypothetical protein M0R72_10975 [Candidatus Pacearchaeota archaeon]|jgi:hypothetical protein|nr:hypothetical protein [Candidatus Pacearchaeota archaeon]
MTESNDNLPKAIREGVLRIGNIELRCAVLDNGKRVILVEDMNKFVAALWSGELLLTKEDAENFAKSLREL